MQNIYMRVVAGSMMMAMMLIGGYAHAEEMPLEFPVPFEDESPEEESEPVSGMLRVTKVLAEGSAHAVADFALFVYNAEGGETEVVSGSDTSLAMGVYTIRESNIFGYTPTFSGDCIEDAMNDSRRSAMHDLYAKRNALMAANNVSAEDDDSYRSAYIHDIEAKILAITNAMSATSVVALESINSCTITNTPVVVVEPVVVPTAYCADALDNDNDGLEDVRDPDCFWRRYEDERLTVEAFDPFGQEERVQKEVETKKGGSSGSRRRVIEGEVLGVTTSVCPAMLGSYIVRGQNNPPEEVKKVQTFLNTFLGTTLVVDGVYGSRTIDAVRAFQQKQSVQVLTPWGIQETTGNVYITTFWYINTLLCPSVVIPAPTVLTPFSGSLTPVV